MLLVAPASCRLSRGRPHPLTLKFRQTSGSCRSWTSSRFVCLRLQHDLGWTGDASVFSYSPEMHDHQHRGDDGNTDAVPDVGAQQGIRIDDRAAQEAEANIVIRRHAEQWSERALVS